MIRLRRHPLLLAAATFWLLTVAAVPAFASLGSWSEGQEGIGWEAARSEPTVAPKAATPVAPQAQAAVGTAPRGGTYVLRDPVTGKVMRSGRTQDLARRATEHGRDPALRDLSFKEVHRTDVYAEQRGLEQLLDLQHKPPLNRIRPISPRNTRLPEYLEAARRFLGGQ
jgi:hypothetical protein